LPSALSPLKQPFLAISAHHQLSARALTFYPRQATQSSPTQRNPRQKHLQRMRITLCAQEIIQLTLLITLLALQAQSAALELPLADLLVSFTNFPVLCNLAVAYVISSYITINPESPQSPKISPAESNSTSHAKPETAKRSTSAARTWGDERQRASSEASFSDASSDAFSFASSSSSGADSSSSGSLPPAQSLPKTEQGTASSDSEANELQFLGEGAYGKVYVDGTDVVKVIPCGSKADQLMAQWEFELHAPLPPGAVKLCDFGLAFLEEDGNAVAGAPWYARLHGP